MISSHPIGNAGDAARYHDKAFARDGESRGADNYYVSEQATARWQGAGAEVLGLTDEAVTREKFIEFLEGKLPNPETGLVEDLADNSKGDKRRAGFDFTVAPPKSVSIVALVGGDERIVAAHQEANKQAMAWLEKHAATVRVRQDGQTVTKQAGNLLYATVSHETNRDNEPHLHNHNVIVSAVYDANSVKWRSLTNDQLLKLRVQADVVYKTALAGGLQRAGYALEYNKNGVDFEIAGFTPTQIQSFAERTQRIDAALVARGIDPANASYEARQAATLDSRAAKHDVARDELHADWSNTARSVGLDLGQLVGRAKDLAAQQQLEASEGGKAAERKGQQSALRSVAFAIEHLSEREQTFTMADLETTSLQFGRVVPLSAIQRSIAEHVRNGSLVDRGVDNEGAALLTTAKGLRNERVLIGHITAGFDKGNVVVQDREAFNQAVRSFEHKMTQETGKPFALSREQLRAARNVLMHPDQYQGVQGDAGTGKTAALALVKDAAESTGWQITGIATSASAARQLGQSTGIPSQTVASFLNNRDNAILATQERIRSLKTEMEVQRSHKGPMGEAPLVERAFVHAKSADLDFGQSRYTFDHQRGDVFRSQNGFTNLLGNFFADLADNRRTAAVDAGRSAESFGQRLQVKANALTARAADKLSHALTTFEPVGIVEATAARNALYLLREPGHSASARELAMKEAELANLQRFGNTRGQRTLLVMDESSMTGASDAAKISELAQAIGARVVFQGDTKQHGSVPAGRAFAQAQEAGMHLSTLTETRRFDNATPQVQDAMKLMQSGAYRSAMARLDTKQVLAEDLVSTVATRYLENLRSLQANGLENPLVGIVALTNADRKDINAEVHEVLAKHGVIQAGGIMKEHLDSPKLTTAEQLHARMLRAADVDRLLFRKSYKELGIQKGDLVRVVGYDTTKNRVIGRTPDGKQILINPQRQDYFTPFRAETREYAVGDRVEARANIKFADKSIPAVTTGLRGVITQIDKDGAAIRWQDGSSSKLDNPALRHVDHAYAHTTFKEQGATNDRQIIAVSTTGARIFNREAAYVAASRARDNTEVITTDIRRTHANAERDVSKSTALDMERFEKALLANRPVAPQRAVEQVKAVSQVKQRGQDQGLSL